MRYWMLPKRWGLHVKEGMIFVNLLKPIVVLRIIDGASPPHCLINKCTLWGITNLLMDIK